MGDKITQHIDVKVEEEAFPEMTHKTPELRVDRCELFGTRCYRVMHLPTAKVVRFCSDVSTLSTFLSGYMLGKGIE